MQARIRQEWDSFNRRFVYVLSGLSGASSILNGSVMAIQGLSGTIPQQIDYSLDCLNWNRRELWLLPIAVVGLTRHPSAIAADRAYVDASLSAF